MRTIIIKKITAITGLLAIVANIYAQHDTDYSYKKKMCDQIMNSTYIFEGKVDSSKYITVKTGQYTYANFIAFLMDVNKVVKGNIQKGTIEVLQPTSGVYYNGPKGVLSGPFPSDGGGPPPNKGLYFCWDTISREPKVSHFANTNAKTIFFYDGQPVYGDKFPKDPRCCGLDFYFPNLSDFYAYISTNYGIKVDGK